MALHLVVNIYNKEEKQLGTLKEIIARNRRRKEERSKYREF